MQPISAYFLLASDMDDTFTLIEQEITSMNFKEQAGIASFFLQSVW